MSDRLIGSRNNLYDFRWGQGPGVLIDCGGDVAKAPLYGDFDVKNKNVVTSTSFLLSLSSDLNFGRDHPFVRPPAEPILPSRPAGSQARRAQGQSRMAVVQVVQRALHLQATP